MVVEAVVCLWQQWLIQHCMVVVATVAYKQSIKRAGEVPDLYYR